MATFRDCILSAQKQGVLSDDEAEALINRYQEHWDARRAAGHEDAEGAAKAGLASELDEIAGRKRQLAALAEQKRDDVKAYLETYKTAGGKSDVFAAAANLIENHGYGAATSSVAGSAKAKFDLAAGELADMLSEFRRSRLTGRRFNKPMAENVAREILGEPTGSPEAQGMGKAVADVFERLRNEFNAAGGNINKLDRYLPQKHDPRAVLSAGRDKWIEYIKPKLDLDKMRDPLTDGPLTPARLDETLKSAWEHISTWGWSDREASAQPFGKGSLANQRNEHRFLQFKTADDWLTYARDFGQGGPIEAIFQHIKGMTRDIAAMETLGPNPNATMEWLKQVVKSEASKTVTGQPSLYNGSANLAKVQDNINYDSWRLQSIYDNVRGRDQASRRIATGFGNLRNVLTAAQLGGASILAAAQDPFIDMSARHLSGLPMTKALWGIASAIKSGSTREAAVRVGLGLEDFAHVLGEEARYAGTLGGAEWSRWLADRTVNLNGLEPITQARKHVFGLDFTAAVADHQNLSWAELGNANRPLQRSMEDYGLTPKDWDKLRKIEAFRPEPDSAGHLRPMDVAQKDRRLAERYLEMILQQTERAVPTGTARSRAFATGTATPGTIVGEIVQSGLQYKSFTLSFMTLQLQALMHEARGGSAAGVAVQGGALAARGAAYAASLGTVMTLAGGLAMQLQNIAAGRDIQAMDTKFWIAAIAKGGGLGILGDFLFNDVSRFGASFLETVAGPSLTFMADVGKAGIGNIQKLVTGEKTHAARDLTNLMGRYTPMLSSLPYTRAAYRRTFLDQLQYLMDPDAHKHFRAQEQQLHRDTGQGYFWKPGESLPGRAPELAEPRKPRH